MTGECIAYLDNGFICGKPALILDLQRGGMVCREYAPVGEHRQTGKVSPAKKEQVNR
jgi:hypothetical protein